MVVTFTAAALIGMSFGVTQLVRRISTTIIDARTAQVHAQLEAFFNPADVLLVELGSLARSSLLDPLEDARLFSWLAPLCERIPQVGALRLCDNAGNSYALIHRGGKWLVSETRPGEWSGRTRYTLYPSSNAPAERQWWVEGADDLRESHWYRGALDSAASAEEPAPGSLPAILIHWTEPYKFETAEDPGITASALLSAQDSRLLVASADLLVADLDEFTDDLHPTPNGYVVLTTTAGFLLEPTSPTEDITQHADDSADAAGAGANRPDIETDQSLMSDAHVAWVASRGIGSVTSAPNLHETDTSRSAERRQDIFHFYSKGKRWWGGFRVFGLSPTAQLYIATLIPEADLMGDIRGMRVIVGLVALMALIVAVPVAMLIARAIGAPITVLARQSERLRKLDLHCCEEVEMRSRITELVQLSEAHASMRNALDSFSRYVPTELVRELLARGEAARIGGRAMPLTILITDIRNFTGLSESMPPSALAEHLAEYFECLLGVLHKGGGTIDKLVGDSVVCFWGAPEPVADHATRALEAWLTAKNALDALNSRWASQGKPTLFTKAGLTLGNVVVGNIGASWRMNYTALGNAVNVASRLEKLNTEYGTHCIAAAAVRESCGPQWAWRLLDRVAVRGKLDPVEIYEPLGLVSEVGEARLAFAEDFGQLVQLFWARRYEDALQLLRTLKEANLDDRSVRLLGDRIEASLFAPHQGA